MFNFICVDGRYTVFVGDTVYDNIPEDPEALLEAITSMDEEGVIRQLKPEYFKELRRLELIKILDKKEGFQFDTLNNQMYYGNIPYAIPSLLLDKILDLVENDTFEQDVLGYLNFWSWCALNPNPNSRHQLFDFLEKVGIQITQDGMLICYRNVDVKQTGDLELTEYVSQRYAQIRKNKKSPSNYLVYRDEDGDLQCKTSIPPNTLNIYGNLEGLYSNIDRFESVFTDNYTKKYKIKLNEPVTMDRSLCDSDPDSDCSYGLHVGGFSFLQRGYFGNKPLMVLVNPMNVVSVPTYNTWKMRVCEYLPLAVVEYDEEGNILSLEGEVLDFDYAKYSLEQLYSMKDYPEDTKLPESIINISTNNLDLYLDMMDSLKDQIKDRLTPVYEDDEEEEVLGEDEEPTIDEEINHFNWTWTNE